MNCTLASSGSLAICNTACATWVTSIIGSGGGQRLADELELPLRGQVPLYPRVLEGGEIGRPIVIAEPESGAAKAIDALARGIAQSLGIQLGEP